MVLLLGGDVELNHGDKWKFLCGICTKPAQINQKGIQCDKCNTWFQHLVSFEVCVERQCGPVVRALALRSGDPGFKTRFDHSLNLFLVVPGSTSQLHL